MSGNADWLGEARAHYAKRPWINEAMRVTGSITISELDARRVYELLRAVRRQDGRRCVELAVSLVKRDVITQQVAREIIKGIRR
jgi:hypothetical protein